VKLVLFKISGDGEYGALSFEQSGESLQEIYEEMVEQNVLGIEEDSDNPKWIVTLEETIEVRDREEANKIVRAIQAVQAEDWCGDSDRAKHTTWDYLIAWDHLVVE
jgi:hypothetical protein